MYEHTMDEYADIMMKLGETIDVLRRERKLTKVALADFSGLQECHIRRIILGRSNVTLLTLLKICTALQITPAEFFARALKPSPESRQA